MRPLHSHGVHVYNNFAMHTTRIKRCTLWHCINRPFPFSCLSRYIHGHHFSVSALIQCSRISWDKKFTPDLPRIPYDSTKNSEYSANTVTSKILISGTEPTHFSILPICETIDKNQNIRVICVYICQPLLVFCGTSVYLLYRNTAHGHIFIQNMSTSQVHHHKSVPFLKLRGPRMRFKNYFQLQRPSATICQAMRNSTILLQVRFQANQHQRSPNRMHKL